MIRQIVLSCLFCYHNYVTIDKRNRNHLNKSFVPLLPLTWIYPCLQYQIMITLHVEENHTLTQSFYNNLITKLQFHQLTCTCGNSGCLHIHGYYERFLKTPAGKLKFRICRVRCECCGKTHAVLPSFIVPYSQISIQDQTNIIRTYETGSSMETVMMTNTSIDESNCRHIIRQYRKYWKTKFLFGRISTTPLSELISASFHFFSYQFMQIRNTSNVLFLNTT